jgi:hypothetical protein
MLLESLGYKQLLLWHGRGHRFDPDLQKQIFSKSYFLRERQLPPMESSAGSAHRHISNAPVLSCLLGESPDSAWTLTHNESGRDRPTERRPRCGNFGCVLNLATSCCQIESRAGTRGFARTSWFLQSHGARRCSVADERVFYGCNG